MATAFSRESFSICLAINPDPNRVGEPYFKMYNAQSWRKATKVARISFKEPKLIKHSSNKESWNTVPRDIRHELIDYLDSESKTFPSFTVWDYLKYEWNMEWGFDVGFPFEYFGGKSDEKFKNEPSYLPSTLESPNYLELE